MFKKHYKKLWNKTYKQVIGKDYRDKMIDENEVHLHSMIASVDKKEKYFDFYSTSHEVYNYQYKNFIKSLYKLSINGITQKEDFVSMWALLGGASILFILSLINFTNIPTHGVEAIIASVLLIFISMGVIFASMNFKKKFEKKIHRATYEKNKIFSFFKKYRSAIGLQSTSLFFVSNKDEEVREIEYSAIKSVFLSAEDEEIKLTHDKYIAGETAPQNTIIETDNYKTAKVKVLNLLLPDNTIFSIIGPTGPNGETVDDLRDIIESKMCGTPINNINDYKYSEDKIMV